MSIPSIDNPTCWRLFCRLINGIILLDLLLLSRSFWVIFGSRGTINAAILAHSDAPLSIWAALAPYPPSVSDGILSSLLVVNVVLACAGLWFGPIRWLGAIQYILYLCFMQSISMGTYGMHEFLKIALFYLMIAGLLGPSPTGPPRQLGTAFRIHLAIGYCAAGVSKSLGAAWWNGESVWRAVQREDMNRWAVISLAHAGLPTWVYIGLAWLTIFAEALYPLALFPQLTLVFVTLLIGMHLGSILFQGLYLFGTTMILFNLFFLFLGRTQKSAQPTSPSTTT